MSSNRIHPTVVMEGDVDLGVGIRASAAERFDGGASDRVRELFTMYETRLLQRVPTDT